MDVVIADSQAKIRSAVRLMLDQQPHLEVLGEAVDATGLMDWVKASSPDLVLLDWGLPGLEAETVLLAMRARAPRLRVIALSGRPEAEEAALQAGADAFVSKGDPPEKLLAAIDRVCVGRRQSKQ